jgi:valyl-tRNA synthetase
MVDWEMAKVHGLREVKVINQLGKIAEGFGEFSGLEVRVARDRIVEKLRAQGLIEGEEDYKNNLSVCERCKTAIEPLISEQWFVDLDHANFSMKQAARQAITNGDIKIYPEKFEKVMLAWIDNIRPWCISRQIWWGPRIPVWYKDGQLIASIESPGDGWLQDEDTFDTWFSSGQWAYSTLGYPNGADYKAYYPSSTMIMGRDILPFWAFRMIILSLYTTGRAPFKNLYFTGLIRDEKGQKMSKSKGNGIEPLEMIKNYGTDAVRLSLVIGSAPGNDMNLGEAKIAGFRNFTNKLWNIARFVIITYPSDSIVKIDHKDLTVADKWILQKFLTTMKRVTTEIDNYNFSLAGELLRDFTWVNFADWYLEVSKIEKTTSKVVIINYILENLLKLWHPFMPFVTEQIWSELGKPNLLMMEKWPTNTGDYVDLDAGNDFELVVELIQAIRNARAENKIEPAKKINAVIFSASNRSLVESNRELIQGMKTGLKEIEVKDAREIINDAIFVAVGEIEIQLLGVQDKEKDFLRIQKEIAEKEKFVKSLTAKLSNAEFVKNAPEKIVALEQEKLAQAQIELDKLQAKLVN